jgi:beta-phosphoglucomutase
MLWTEKFDLFLFDFDGLLVDTERLHYQAYMNVLLQKGLNLPWDFEEYCARAHLNATAIKEGICALFPEIDPSWDNFYREKKRAYLSLLEQGGLQMMPGAESLLSFLDQKKKRSCVATHSPIEQIETIRRHLPVLNLIPHWLTREDYTKPKPDPECYLKAISLYGKEGDRIIGFEDTIRGLQALEQTVALPVLICSANHPLISKKGRGLHFTSLDLITY